MERVELIEAIGRAMEGAGVAIATVHFLTRWRGGNRSEVSYRDYRRGMGKSILLGLEFLVAGDIIRTVAVELTFRSVGILAIIVAICTVLSLELQLEIEGRWPWQQAADDATPGLAHTEAVQPGTVTGTQRPPPDI